jgi:hypothetical protein
MVKGKKKKKFPTLKSNRKDVCCKTGCMKGEAPLSLLLLINAKEVSPE